MTSETEALLAILRGESIPVDVHWPAFMQAVDSHGLLMLIRHDHPSELPEEFAGRARSQWTTSAWLASELKALLWQFSAHAIEVITLKGPLLATLLYGSPSQRISDDLDLLVRAEQFPQAEALLVTLGFRSVYPSDDYHHSFARDGLLVELHFATAPPSNPTIDLSTAWARAPKVDFQGEQAFFFAPPDLLLYLVIHLVKHDFARLIWLLDTNLALRALNHDELKEALTMARRIGVVGAFLTTCALIEAVFQQPLPPLLAAEVARKPAIEEQAERILEKLMQTTPDASTAHQGAQTFVELEYGFRSRWLQRLRAFKPSHQDLAWAKMHHLSPRWMPLLRPMRLVTKHGVGAAWRVLFPRSGNTARAWH